MPPESSTGTEAEPTLPAQGVGEAAGGTPEGDAKGSESSAEQGAKEHPKSPLAAVMSALADTKADADAAAKTAVDQADETSPGSEKGDQGTDQPNPDDRFDKHPRFKELTQQRDHFKAAAEAHADKVQRFDTLAGFLEQNRISSDDFANALKILATAKANPDGALELLQPLVEQLQLQVGRRLPADLQERVDRGAIDEETAGELARRRAAETRLRNELETTTRERAQADEAQRARAEHEEFMTRANSIAETITKWERDWAKSDPDYPKKARLLMDRVQADFMTTLPGTPEEALERIKKAKGALEAELKSMLPTTREPARTVTSGGAGPSSTPTPKSSLEVVRAALRSR